MKGYPLYVTLPMHLCIGGACERLASCKCCRWSVIRRRSVDLNVNNVTSSPQVVRCPTFPSWKEVMFSSPLWPWYCTDQTHRSPFCMMLARSHDRFSLLHTKSLRFWVRFWWNQFHIGFASTSNLPCRKVEKWERWSRRELPASTLLQEGREMRTMVEKRASGVDALRKVIPHRTIGNRWESRIWWIARTQFLCYLPIIVHIHTWNFLWRVYKVQSS